MWSPPMWTSLAWLRACRSNSLGAFATWASTTTVPLPLHLAGHSLEEARVASG